MGLHAIARAAPLSQKLGLMTASPIADGETIDELVGRFEVVSDDTLKHRRHPRLIRPSLLDRQIVAAVRESAHKHVQTLEEAFAAVDKQQIKVRELRDPEGGEALTVIDYGSGGNSYGAVFRQNEALPTAAIRDGDVALK